MSSTGPGTQALTRRAAARLARLAALALALMLVWGAAARAQSAAQIIAAADRVRNPGRPFRLTNTLTEYRSGQPADRLVLTIFAKEDRATGQFRNLVRFSQPARDAGKMMLKVGNSMWFYDPASKASVRLSAQQRLIGQASNGDAVTVNLAKDYQGVVLGNETIQDADRTERACWHLDLKATAEDATYHRIETWIEHRTYYPIKAKYYSDSGRLLKIVYYRNFRRELGGMRPTEAIIIDAVDTRLVTTMVFSDYRAQEIPESWFQRESLPRLGSQ